METTLVTASTVECHGSEGPKGHPSVYLNLAPLGKVSCPYCGRCFIYKNETSE